ncbi:sigma-70 family RNA polymerase sigma factor [Fulvivirga maritima]|uniref:RNA polymerase sigma factor n=1 Tax=Fulvivirga maritima TaxID=2904247 RepID=UPI001F2078B6|nr:sigma-70 family RNA polymerase sigma factor [Fulvivirga maritima]UII26749.1 sigma-70 family RNA polymerase sigma factor [Fulvivirga maritima]
MKAYFDHYNDTQLMRLIKNDNELALQILFDRYYDSLLEISFHFLTNVALAEEVVADIFIRIWEKRYNINVENLKGYLYTAAKNLSINKLDKEKYSFHSSKNIDTPYSTDPERDIQFDEMFQQIDYLISQMPGQRQLVFRLNKIDGLAYKEIAKLLEISVETVQKHMSLAVKYMALYKDQIYGMAHYLTTFMATSSLLLIFLKNLLSH